MPNALRPARAWAWEPAGDESSHGSPPRQLLAPGLTTSLHPVALPYNHSVSLAGLAPLPAFLTCGLLHHTWVRVRLSQPVLVSLVCSCGLHSLVHGSPLFGSEQGRPCLKGQLAPLLMLWCCALGLCLVQLPSPAPHPPKAAHPLAQGEVGQGSALWHQQ